MAAFVVWSYPQYREDGVANPEVGNTPISIPMLATANPVGRSPRTSGAVSVRPAPGAARYPPTMQDVLLTWYAASARDLPWRRTHDPYAILVSEVMLQQSPIGLARTARTLATMRY